MPRMEAVGPTNTRFGVRTASKIGWRELRAAPAKFVFVVLAVAVGVAALSGIKGFGSAFRGMLLHNAKQLIAADLQAQTWESPTVEQIQKLEAIGSHAGRMTRVTETVSMAGSNRQRAFPQMISVKAVDPTLYPFYGKIGLQPPQPLATLLSAADAVVVTPSSKCDSRCNRETPFAWEVRTSESPER